MNLEQLEADRAQKTADALWHHVRSCGDCQCHVKWFIGQPEKESQVVIEPCQVGKQILKHFHL